LNTPGWIVTNPPYGVRVNSNKDLRDLYARFGSIILNSFNGWQVGVLCNDPVLAGNLGLSAPDSEWRLINGGIPVKFQIYKI
jgi:23S rRNA (guanine2445-N2)-methyltransferase / 23S rRNA (guanine2069-N7)-methyltransferase